MKIRQYKRHFIVAALAAATVSALCWTIFITAHAADITGTTDSPRPAIAQTPAAPLFNLNTEIELKQPDSTTVPKGSPPVLPHETLRSLPPSKPGCYHLVNGVWEEVPCATEEQMKKIPPPYVTADTIQSTAHHLIGKTSQVTAPLVWGAVATTVFNLLPPPSSYPCQFPNSYSIQANTNGFVSPTSYAGFPFSESQPGDRGWVQFVYQQAGDTADNDVSTERLCVWNFDLTSACSETNAAGTCIGPGFQSYCVYPWYTLYSLPGPLPTDDFSEVVGYVLCNQGPYSPNGCTLTVLGYLATAPDPSVGWWGTVAPDNMGLGGAGGTAPSNWTSVGGSMYGMGGGTEAVFHEVEIFTEVVADSCSAANYPTTSAPTLFTPKQCSSAQRSSSLTATLASAHGNGTAETNNLTPQPATFSCTDYQCILGWWGVAP